MYSGAQDPGQDISNDVPEEVKDWTMTEKIVIYMVKPFFGKGIVGFREFFNSSALGEHIISQDKIQKVCYLDYSHDLISLCTCGSPLNVNEIFVDPI